MRINLSSIAFNCPLEKGGGTPAWSTELGQSAGYKITADDSEEIILAMTNCFYPKDNVECPLGKGGKIYRGSETNEIQQAAWFNKTYINGILVEKPFVLLIVIEQSDHHYGRKSLKFSNKIVAKDEKGQMLCNNNEFYLAAAQKLGITKNACWFVYDLSAKNQDELHFSAIIVDKEEVTYEDSADRKRKWIALLEQKRINYGLLPNSPSSIPLQTIFFGTPGSGKSHKVSELTEGNPTFRTTFHPDSDYATFVGCYKPIVTIVEAENQTSQPAQYLLAAEPTAAYGKSKKELSYQFVPQAFTNAYVQAWKNLSTPHFLVIEEINRGNCAQIFGDLFQLLDRSVSGFSEYPIQADTDLQKYLAQAFAEEDFAEDFAKVKTGENLILPANLSILATMNTSDQSLFPMDSAFKRRWDWEYVAIDYQNSKSEKFVISINGDKYAWHDFLKEVNEHIKRTTDSEDKQMGNFFIKGDISEEAFKSKVMFYIWSEVCKDEFGTRRNFFRNGNEADNPEFSFNELYGSNGTALLQGFMQYIGVEPIAQTTENEA